MEYKVNYKQYEFIVTQNDDGSFNIPEDIRDLEPFGTALKPAAEYIVVARKPLSEKSVALNVLKWGTGGINIDGCRVGTELISHGTSKMDIRGKLGDFHTRPRIEVEDHITEGRFPANIILECICDEVIKGEKGEVKEHNGTGGIWNEGTKEPVGRTYNDKGDIHTNPMCPCYMMDEQSGVSKSNCKSGVVEGKEANVFNDGEKKKSGHKKKVMVGDYSDKGGASRFFYQAKVSKAERNMGLDGIILQLSNFCILIDYNNKEVKLWESTEQKARHQEVMELLTQKGIEELQLKKVMENTICEWNTGLYGNNTTDLYQMVGTFITLMVTNLITELKILNVSVEQNTNENISECILKTDFGGNIVASVMNGNQKNIIIEQKKDGCQDIVNLVELQQQLKIGVKENKNIHSTVKPVNLMAYLCRLVTPPNGICLDPFMGSGSTGIAAQLEGFRFCGMELDEDYFKIAEARINDFESYRKFIK
jgi:riboflavin synthase